MVKLIKIYSIILTFIFTFISLNPISFAENNKNASDTSSCSYNCQKDKTNNPNLLVRADTQTGNKQSTTRKICSSITNILTNEIGKTKNKTKKGILQGGLKYTNEICGKGGTPDLNKVTEGLPEQDRLRISQKTNAALFDGVDPNLKQENLTNVSGTLPSLTGKDGKITDLKSYDPTLPAASSNPVPELKTALTQKVSTAGKIEPFVWDNEECICKDCKTPTGKKDIRILAKNKEDCKKRCQKICEDTDEDEVKPIPPTPPTPEPTPEPKPEKKCDEGFELVNDDCVPKCTGGQIRNPETRECECSAGKVTIDGPKDLLLFKTYTNSPRISFKVTTSKPPSKIQWSVSNEKIKFTSGTNKPTVQVIPTSESKSEGDVTITATVDNCPPVSLALTVRRPVSIEHEPLKFGKSIKYVLIPHVGTAGKFIWTVKDQFSKPLGNTRVSEVLWCDSALSSVKCWKAGFFSPYWPWPGSALTNSDGAIHDEYAIPVLFLPKTFKIVIHQDLGCQGYTGKSDVVITESSIVGTSPVELK